MHDELRNSYARAQNIIAKLGLPSDSLYDVMDDIEKNRDNLFIIKAHALMETLISYLLSTNIQLKNQSEEHSKKFAKFLSSLNMRGKNGSLKLAHNLGIITKDIYDFTDTLAELRNIYAHSIKDIRSPLEMHLNKNRRDKLDIINAFKTDNSLPDSTIKLIICIGITHCLSYADMHSHHKHITLLGSD